MFLPDAPYMDELGFNLVRIYRDLVNMSVTRYARFLPAAITASAISITAHVEYAHASPPDMPVPDKQFVIDLGAGALYQPKYPGADSNRFSPLPLISVQRFFIPGLGQVADGKEKTRGVYFFPSFDFNSGREASDSPSLTGTSKIDWAVELGIGVGYRYDWLRGHVALRQGINGHDGQVAEFGIDAIMTPMERLELIFGPRATWASDDYMDTYFGVTAAEAAAPGSTLAAYNPSASFKTVGLDARANYALTDKTIVHVRGGWDRFVGDAANSPIVLAGSRDQFSIGLGLSYRFAFDLFN